MSDRQFSLAVAMSPLEHIVPLAQVAEECGFTSIALPDSLFYSEQVSADYPYTTDGSRMWDQDTPWPDPLIAAGAIGAATTTIRSYTQVLKLGSRNPLLLSRQLLTVAALKSHREKSQKARRYNQDGRVFPAPRGGFISVAGLNGCWEYLPLR